MAGTSQPRADPRTLLLFSPTVQLTWAGVCAAALVALLAADGAAGALWGGSFMAPTAADLWLGVGLGGLAGAAVAAGERVQLTRGRAALLAFYRTPEPERFRWRNLLLGGWGLALVMGLIGLCAWSQVFVLPPLLAMNVVAFAGNAQLARGFRDELANGRGRAASSR